MNARPPVLWLDGAVVPWADGTVHLWSEVATRGTNVFEGIRVYEHADGSLHMLCLAEHMARLEASCRLLRLPSPVHTDELTSGMMELLQHFRGVGSLYVRPTIYLVEGRYAENLADCQAGSYVVAVPVAQSAHIETGIGCLVSRYHKAPDLTLSPLIKTGSAYGMYRLPMLEARDAGLQDAILLNSRDEVAEATGASVFAVKDGAITTPPLSAGILDSITRRNLIMLARDDLGLQVGEAAMTPSMLMQADEVFLAGTLAEVVPVVRLGTSIVGTGEPGPVTRAVHRHYLDVCEGRRPDARGWLTAVVGGRGNEAR